jgi:DNA polymerase III delta prime subunit
MLDFTHLHHAYAVETGYDTHRVREAIDRIREALEHRLHAKLGAHNPDFHTIEVDVFSIDDARALKDTQSHHAVGTRDDDRNVFFIIAQSITREAQNALLKVFEEPSSRSLFFLFIPSAELLLPTITSRMHIITMSGAGSSSDSERKDDADIASFLQSTPAKRLAALKEIIEEKDRGRAHAFLNSIELHLSKKRATIKSAADLAHNSRSCEHLYLAKKYLGDQSSSVKMILEYVCLFV